jgi:hypothetical protein
MPAAAPATTPFARQYSSSRRGQTQYKAVQQNGPPNWRTPGPHPLRFSKVARSGSGRAVHLGVITWFSDETVQFLSCSPPSTPGPAIAVSGHFKILAANGDEIDGEYQTTGFDTVNGVSVHGGYTFVSGTGRFTNVTGSGVIVAHGVANPPFDFVGSLDGTIRYSGE